ncbi:NAD-dependent epimerase/dehydratase family protein [Dapis sp. BLCC M126]|uniref:NAD-dependent epimerase/dehydratase family protein n=1 Tax=Dapis sp. BLCC M126 TaxID=3400189 RepID=UPI003CEA3221
MICGATGFIGRNFTESFALKHKYEVHAVWHQRPPFELDNVTWYQGDLRNPQDVERLVAGMDVIIQAAGTTYGSKYTVNQTYVHITDRPVMNSLLLRAAFDCNVEHFVFFSCTVMYQSSEKALLEDDFDASQELHPRYFGTGWTKLYVEKMCEFFARMGRTRHTVIRHSNIYGPYDKYDLEHSHVFGATVTKVMTANEKIVVWGTGEEKRDLLHVDDLVKFVELSLSKQTTPYELFNCGLGKAISIRKLVEMMVKVSGKSLEIEHDLSKSTIKTSLFLDCNKAKQQLGWEPVINLEEGIRRTLEWYHKNIL